MSPEGSSRHALEEGLHRLNEHMQTLAELSELAIRKAVAGLQDLDTQTAHEVFALDHEIYGLQTEIEKNCVDLIALHAPVARDLRTITTSLKIVTDLDRIGRYARDIAEAATEISRHSTTSPEKIEKLGRMADLTIHMVDTSIRSFTNRDAASVRAIAEFDNAVDDLYDEIFKDLTTEMDAGTLSAELGVQYILVSRYLERIADHAVNVGLRVIYMVTGERQEKAKLRHSAPQP